MGEPDKPPRKCEATSASDLVLVEGKCHLLRINYTLAFTWCGTLYDPKIATVVFLVPHALLEPCCSLWRAEVYFSPWTWMWLVTASTNRIQWSNTGWFPRLGQSDVAASLDTSPETQPLGCEEAQAMWIDCMWTLCGCSGQYLQISQVILVPSLWILQLWILNILRQRQLYSETMGNKVYYCFKPLVSR